MENIFESLKNCKTENEVIQLMKGRVYPNSDNSKFEDSFIRLYNGVDNYINCPIKVKGLYSLGLRLVFFLKMSGKINLEIRGIGIISYFQAFRFIMQFIESKNPNILYLRNITPCTIDEFINLSRNKSRTLDQKLNKLKDWIYFANYYLPKFLQLDENLLKNSKYYLAHKQKVFKARRKENCIGHNKKYYSLANLKILLSSSIEYMEKYKKEILSFSKELIIIANKPYLEKYELLFFKFKTFKDFTEPTLKRLKETCSLTKTKSTNRESQAVKFLYKDSVSVIEKLEASATIILLFMTGMRKSEILSLKRYPKIIKDDFYNLERMEYKTAYNKEGDIESFPIPIVAKKAIDVLSELALIKDGKKEGPLYSYNLNLNKERSNINSNTLNLIINKFCMRIGIEPPTPHQFRHAIAFLMSVINEKEGMDIAKLFLNHKSILMTIQYLGHSNPFIKKVLIDDLNNGTNKILEKVISEVEDGKMLYGPQGERLMGDYFFQGSYVDNFADILNRGITEILKKGHIAIIQTSICFCIHDLSKQQTMNCQRGIKIDDKKLFLPLPSRCDGENCNNALFLEEHLNNLKKTLNIDTNLKKRLLENSYFLDDGGFDQYNIYKGHKNG